MSIGNIGVGVFQEYLAKAQDEEGSEELKGVKLCEPENIACGL